MQWKWSEKSERNNNKNSKEYFINQPIACVRFSSKTSIKLKTKETGKKKIWNKTKNNEHKIKQKGNRKRKEQTK